MSNQLTHHKLFQAYPDSELLGCGPPEPDESWVAYVERAAYEAGDTLFLFLLRELFDDGKPLPILDVYGRLRGAIEDLEEVRDYVCRMLPPPGESP